MKSTPLGANRSAPWRRWVGAAPILLQFACTGTVGDDGIGPVATTETGGSSANAGAGNLGTPAGGTGSIAAGGSSPGGQSFAGGTADNGSLPNPTPEACPVDATDDPGPAISRRLTRTEYNNTVADLLGDTTRPASGEAFPPEELSHNFDNDPSALTVSPVLAEAYFTTAEKLAATAVQNNMSTLVPCAASAGRSCGEQFVKSFGAKAFRRPVQADEVTRFMKVFDKGAETDFSSGVRLVVTSMLQSAPFLYRIESGDGQAGTTPYLKLTAHELATRLSYLFLKSMPDAALTQSADGNQLQSAAQVETQARRLLSAARLKQTVVDFHDQWLGLRRLANMEKDKTIFANFAETSAADMRTEASKFIEDVLFGSTPNASLLLTSSTTFVNRGLAQLYGVTAPSGNDFQKVTLDASRRAGLLTLGGVLSVNAKANQTSPVIRGKFIREQLLCQPLTPPPGNVDTQVPDISPTATTRERFQQHQADPTCAACHQYMDPLGLGFENYDAVGKWRDTESGKTIDASGEVSFADLASPKFVGPAELGKKLAESAQVKRCMVTNWYRYANARVETEQDACTISALAARFAEKNYDVKELMVALTQTDAFLYRRSNTQGGAQ